MVLFDITNPLTLFLILIAAVLVVLLGKETKKGIIVGIMLMVFLGILIFHSTQLALADRGNAELIYTVSKCMAFDFAFILLSFLSYLWIDHLDAEANKKKTIDDSLNWFWNKV